MYMDHFLVVNQAAEMRKNSVSYSSESLTSDDLPTKDQQVIEYVDEDEKVPKLDETDNIDGLGKDEGDEEIAITDLDEVSNADDEEVEEIEEFLTEHNVGSEMLQEVFGKEQKPSDINVRNEFDEYMEIFFPKKIHDDILVDEFMVSRDESEKRVFVLLLFLSLILSIVATSLLFFVISELPDDPIVLQPQIPIDQFNRNRPTTHLAFVFVNGTILDWSLSEKVSPSKGHFPLRLPFSPKYHGYADSKGILYFVDGQLKKAVLQYYDSFEGKGYSKIGFKTPVNATTYLQSALIGQQMWLLGSSGASLMSHSLFMLPNVHTKAKERTKVWFTKRHVMKNGPVDFKNLSSPYTYCTLTLNTTHVMFIGMESVRIAVIQEFRGENRVELVEDMHFWPHGHFVKIECALLLSKGNERLVFVHLQAYLDNTEATKNFPELKSIIQMYDLSQEEKGHWDNLISKNVHSKVEKLFVSNGILFSIMSDGSIINHANGSDWIENKNGFDSSADISTIVPYLA